MQKLDTKVMKVLKNNYSQKLDYSRVVDFVNNFEGDMPKDLEDFCAAMLRQFSKGRKSSPKICKKNDVAWVDLAVSKDQTRPHLMTVCSPDAHTLVSTDGHRMHVVTDNSKEYAADARYSVVKGELIEVPSDERFPPYKEVIPTYSTETVTVTLKDFAEDIDEYGKPRLIYTKTVNRWNQEKEESFQEEVQIGMSKAYVLDAFGGRDSMKMSTNEHLDPVLFTSENRLAVVMPLRLKN